MMEKYSILPRLIITIITYDEKACIDDLSRLFHLIVYFINCETAKILYFVFYH